MRRLPCMSLSMRLLHRELASVVGQGHLEEPSECLQSLGLLQVAGKAPIGDYSMYVPREGNKSLHPMEVSYGHLEHLRGFQHH